MLKKQGQQCSMFTSYLLASRPLFKATSRKLRYVQCFLGSEHSVFAHSQHPKGRIPGKVQHDGLSTKQRSQQNHQANYGRATKEGCNLRVLKGVGFRD